MFVTRLIRPVNVCRVLPDFNPMGFCDRNVRHPWGPQPGHLSSKIVLLNIFLHGMLMTDALPREDPLVAIFSRPVFSFL